MSILSNVTYTDSIIRLNGTMLKTDGNTIEIPYANGGNYWAGIFKKANNELKLEYSGVVPSKVIAIFEYTKTTD